MVIEHLLYSQGFIGTGETAVNKTDTLCSNSSSSSPIGVLGAETKENKEKYHLFNA